MARAIMQRWPMTENVRKAVIAKLVNVLTDPASSKREMISAAKALISAEKQNQDDQHKAIDFALNTGNDRISAIANNLGIDAALIVDAASEANRSSKGTEEREGNGAE